MPQTRFEKVVLPNGKEANIPVGDDGYVPVDALLTRFNSVVEKGHVRNRSRDYDDHATVVLPLKMTPREAAAWWASPNSYDIEYIDAPGKIHKNLGQITDPESKKIHEKIDIICLPSEEKEIRKIIDEAYPLEERKKLVKDGNVTVVVRPLEDSAGNIVGRKIELDRDHGKNNSTLVHEGLHHLRKVDKDRRGPITKAVDGSDKNSLVIEESCTVAEQMARGKNPRSGYYAYAQVYDEKKKKWRYPTEAEANKMMAEDRALFTNGTNKPLSGNKAIESVEKNWAKSNIARLKLPGTKRAITAMASVTDSVKDPTQPRTAKSGSKKPKSAGAKKTSALSEKKPVPKKQTAKKKTTAKKTAGKTGKGKQTRRR